MTLLRYLIPVALVVSGLFCSAGTASAAWNNVYQVCCNDCPKARASYYPPAPQAQPHVQVNYIQRSYYQPVTEYVQKSYYEPVTRNYTSYYYEPVTSYSYTTYYDPCSGCPQKIATPVTSYRLRSQCNSATSYVQRCAMVPVTTLKPVTVRQPVVTYYYPPEPVCPPTGSSYGSPMIPQTGPVVDELRPPASVVPSAPSTQGGMQETMPATNLPTAPGMSLPRSPAIAPKPRLDRTASRSGIVTVRGEVVMADQLTPRPGTKIVFVRADKPTVREYATANAYGEFDTQLPAGNWIVYLGSTNGQAVYHKQVSLGDQDSYNYRVVSR